MTLSSGETVIWSEESKFEFKLKPKLFKASSLEAGASQCKDGLVIMRQKTKFLVDKKMNGASYIDILQLSAQNMDLDNNFVYQQDNDPKHTSKVAKEPLELLKWFWEWPAIEHLWSYLSGKLNRSACSTNNDHVFIHLRELCVQNASNSLRYLYHCKYLQYAYF